MPTVHVVAAAIIQGGRCLVAQRGEGMSLAGKWEFPGGKVEPGESASAALAREILEELGLEVLVGTKLATGTEVTSTRTIVLDVYAATIVGGSLAVREHAQVVWAESEELDSFDWAQADVPCVEPVRSWMRGG